jgi:hypothetical protein
MALKAAEDGNIELLKMLIHKNMDMNNICYHAAKKSRLNVIEWLKEMNYPLEYTWRAAIKHDLNNIIIWAVVNDVSVDLTSYREAVKRNKLHWLRTTQQYKDTIREDTCIIAAEFGNANLFKCTFDDKHRKDKRICRFAIESGNIDIMTFALSKGCELPDNPESICANSGSVEFLKWMVESDYIRPDASTFASAASNKNDSCMTYLESIGCPFDEKACGRAAYLGRLVNLGWLRKRGCPWDKTTCQSAALRGHLDVLAWCRKEGCPWDWKVCAGAAMNKHHHIVKWAIANGCDTDTKISLCAIENDDVNLLEWLKQARILFHGKSRYYAKKWKKSRSMKWFDNNEIYTINVDIHIKESILHCSEENLNTYSKSEQ